MAPAVIQWLAGQQVLTQLLLVAAAAVVLILLANGDKNSVTGASMLMGVGCGIAMERRWVGFGADGPLWQRVVRLLVGVMGLGILFGLLHVLFDPVKSVLLVRLIRYGLLGWWISCGAPLLFLKLGLARKE